MKAILGGRIACVMNHPPGLWIERKTEVVVVLRTQAAVDFANSELIPSGRWKVKVEQSDTI